MSEKSAEKKLEVQQYLEKRETAVALSRKQAYEHVNFPEEVKRDIVEAAEYISYPHAPYPQDFIETYMLNPQDHPVPESRLVQAIMELEVRVSNLTQSSNDFADAGFEKEKLEIDLKEAEIALSEITSSMHQGVSEERLALMRSRQDVEIREIREKIKRLDIKKANLDARAAMQFIELKNFKNVLENQMKTLGLKDLRDFDFSKVRMKEMSGKLELMGKLQAMGNLDMTPSKMQAIMSNQKDFAKGFIKGKMEQIPDMMHRAAHLEEIAGKVGGEEAVRLRAQVDAIRQEVHMITELAANRAESNLNVLPMLATPKSS